MFDDNFQKQKVEFQKQYGMTWDQDKALFTQYLRLRYESAQAENFAQAVNAIGNDVSRIMQSISTIASYLQNKR